ncbi:MAG: HAD family phosphatase [Lachnospira sp.]|nr:HAD family phosphatase [Lachnospira sp.]
MNAVIFDMDGVIFDSEQLVKACWEEVGEQYQIENIGYVFYKCLGTNKAATRVILNEHYGDALNVDTFFKDTRELFYKYVYEFGMPMKPYIRQLLVKLKEMDYAIGLASSTRFEAIVEELTMTGLINYFDYIVGGDMVANSKPDPEIFLKCCAGLHKNPKDTYVIEDSYNGIRAAYAAGMKAIMVPDMVMPDEEMKSMAVVAKNLKEVMNILCDE